jgi:hypothetical protein
MKVMEYISTVSGQYTGGTNRARREHQHKLRSGHQVQKKKPYRVHQHRSRSVLQGHKERRRVGENSACLRKLFMLEETCRKLYMNTGNFRCWRNSTCCRKLDMLEETIYASGNYITEENYPL